MAAPANHSPVYPLNKRQPVDPFEVSPNTDPATLQILRRRAVIEEAARIAEECIGFPLGSSAEASPTQANSFADVSSVGSPEYQNVPADLSHFGNAQRGTADHGLPTNQQYPLLMDAQPTAERPEAHDVDASRVSENTLGPSQETLPYNAGLNIDNTLLGGPDTPDQTDRYLDALAEVMRAHDGSVQNRRVNV